jgi:phosphatidylserine synthase
MKVRYPMEAFALAMVVFSQNMRDALITGILILLITTLGLVLDRLFGGKIPKWSRNSCIILLMVSLTHSLFQIIIIAVLGYQVDNTAYILHIFLGMLISKHIIHSEGDTDYNRLMLEGAGAFATLLIISIIREFMSEGTIYGFEIADFRQLSNGFSQVVMGFILAGIGIAILNRIYYRDFAANVLKAESLFVILPVVLLVQPFTIDSVSPSVSTVITISIVFFLLYSVRRFLVFSRLSREIKQMPVELLSTGIIYMILSMF